MKPVLECKGVSHTYAGQHSETLHDFEFSVGAGEFVVLVGASGCGKTTLLRILSGLLMPSAGRVFINGADVTGRPGPERAMVFQGDRLYPWRTAAENVAFGFELRGIARDRYAPIVQENLSLVGLPEHGHLYPHQLSGGMRQRVNVARALALDPAILMMDEPFSALDAQTREMMQVELLALWEKQQKAVMFVTHQIEEAVYLADRVVVLAARPGRVKRTFDVDIPRPRDLHTKRSPEFQALCEGIWAEIEEDVRTAMQLEKAVP